MKKKNILTLVLLFLMSFQILHAYVIDALDTHSCDVSEYVVEFDKPIHDKAHTDICDIHHGFHLTFIVPDIQVYKKQNTLNKTLFFFTKNYTYASVDNFLKPPIFL